MDSGEILTAFDGRGVVRVYDYVGGAVLLERLDPGHSLAHLALGDRDGEATAILADVIAAMSSVPSEAPAVAPTVQDWATSFDRYAAGDDDQLPADLVASAARLYSELGASQGAPRLLHADLQHYNVLYDRHRGWVAIDPKGVVGELAYEIGCGAPEPNGATGGICDRTIVERRIGQFASALGLDPECALAWTFAQAVLSAIWGIEDGYAVDSGTPAVRLATVIRPMLGRII